MQLNDLKITQGGTEYELIEFKPECIPPYTHITGTPSFSYNGRFYYLQAIANKPKEDSIPEYEIGTVVKDTFTDLYYTKNSTGFWHNTGSVCFTIKPEDIGCGKRYHLCPFGYNPLNNSFPIIQKEGNSFTPFITEDGYNVVLRNTTIYATQKNDKGEWRGWCTNGASYTGNEDTKYFYKKENRDRWVEENTKKPYYEIQCIQVHSHNCWIQKDGLYKSGLYEIGSAKEFLLESRGVIHSVKRLSDGEIFTVNEVCQDEVGHVFKPIKKFFINEGVMYAQFNEGYGNNDGCLGLNALVKYTKKPLLKLDDGTDVFEGDTIHIAHVGDSELRSIIVDYNFSSIHLINAKKSGYYWFSTKEKAQDWLDENKIRFSLSDIRNNFKNEPLCSYTIDFIIKTLKNLKP